MCEKVSQYLSCLNTGNSCSRDRRNSGSLQAAIRCRPKTVWGTLVQTSFRKSSQDWEHRHLHTFRKRRNRVKLRK
jgi:hypothetical protein